jgi:D-alanyl-D-alanine carboxypeptidase
MERTRSMQSHFAPGTKGRAVYSDANFQLLGKIITAVTGKEYYKVCREQIIDPLGLSSTYLYQTDHDDTPMHLYYKAKELLIPKAMASFGPDGGMVSNSIDMLVFIEAFFTGRLFPAEYLPELEIWNSIFFPMKAGVGLHLFSLPWVFNPTGALPSFIGHSGLSGALAYYCPRDKVYFAGTVNQIASPDLSFRTMIKLSQIITKE